MDGGCTAFPNAEKYINKADVEGKTKHHKQHPAYANVGEMCWRIDKPCLRTERPRRHRFAQRCARPSFSILSAAATSKHLFTLAAARANPTCTAEAPALFVVLLGFVFCARCRRQMSESRCWETGQKGHTCSNYPVNWR